MAPPALPVIALVSSIGGLRATSAVLGPLPPGLPAAVVALQHQEPDRTNQLAELLAHRTGLTVRPARDGAPLTAGVVDVAPPGWHTLVTPGLHLALVPSGAFPPSRPSADLLLATLAMACGPSAVAVVLSGSGHDAAAGAAVVHHRGGTVLVTDELTSEDFSMPFAAIRQQDLVDEVLPLELIAARLTELAAALAARTAAGP